MSKLSNILSFFKLAVPVSLSLLGYMLMQWVDIRFVGRLGAASVGAVGVGSALFSWAMVPGLALGGALEYWIGDAVGRHRPLRARSDLMIQLGIAAIYALVIGGLLWFFGGPLFEQIELTHQVRAEATAYLRMLVWSLFPLVAAHGIRAYLGAYGATFSAWNALLLGNGINLLGNYLWVPTMGVEGSALATVFARVAILAMFMIEWGVIEVRRVPKRRRWFMWSIKRIKEILRIALPSAGQVMLEVGAFSVVVLWTGRFGESALAAHQSVLQLAGMAFMIPLGFGSAAATLVSRAHGAGHLQTARRFSSIAVGATLGWAFLVVVLMVGFADRVFATYQFTDPEVIVIGERLLGLVAWMHFSDALQACLTGVLRGWGDTVTGFWANALGHWAIGIPIAVFVSLRIGVDGVWWGLSSGVTVVAVILGSKLYRLY